ILDDKVKGHVPVKVISPGQLEIIANRVPQIRVTQPTLGSRDSVVWQNDYEIEYLYLDDDTTTIELFHDRDRNVGGEVLIASLTGQASPRDATDLVTSGISDRFTWDISDVTRVPAGNYYIKARIADGVNSTTVYSEDYIRVNKRPTFQFVTDDPAAPIVQGETFRFRWDAADPDSPGAQITLILRSNTGKGTVSLVEPFAVSSGLWELALQTATRQPDDYSIIGSINDGVNPPVTDEIRFILQKNEPPSIAVLRPDVQDSADIIYSATFLVRWTDADPESSAAISNATVSLYMDTNNFGWDGTLLSGSYITGNVIYPSSGIPANIDNDGTEDVFVWDLSQVPSGRYFVYAKILDGVNAPVYSYSSAAVTINKRPTLTFTSPRPGGMDSVAVGANYEIAWEAYDMDSQATLWLAVDDDNDPYDEDGIGRILTRDLFEKDGHDGYNWNTSGFQPGIYYVVARLDDGGGNPVIVYSDGRVLVTSAGELTMTFLRPDANDSLG
ncbi:MAG TPA: hypothetical protein PKH07_10910, partial [bacterium]|nr:hypothetical protein [bacterium]